MASYILFDTETTGNQEEDRIIQVGAMVLEGKNVEVYDEMCTSEVPISIEAMEVHNITPNLLEGKPTFDSTNFSKRVNELNSVDNYLIAHNISFDLSMIEKENFTNQYTIIDTLRCSKHLLPDSPYHRLQYLRYALELYKEEQEEANKHNITIKAHDAIGDVLIMKLLLSKLTQLVKEQFHLSGEAIMQKLAQLSQTPVLIKKFTFGKYKGREIEEIATADSGYLKWMRNNMEDLSEDMIFTLDRYL